MIRHDFPGYVRVTFEWDKKHGRCYDCGLPAAFYLPLAYGRGRREDLNTENRRCAVCAANAAADGEIVERIEIED